jgi:hypothetical protein
MLDLHRVNYLHHQVVELQKDGVLRVDEDFIHLSEKAFLLAFEDYEKVDHTDTDFYPIKYTAMYYGVKYIAVGQRET